MVRPLSSLFDLVVKMNGLNATPPQNDILNAGLIQPPSASQQRLFSLTGEASDSFIQIRWLLMIILVVYADVV
jgi:hypothetical protein